MSKRMIKWIRRSLWLVLIVLVAYMGYHWYETQPALSPVKTTTKKLLTQKKTYNASARKKIASHVGENDQTGYKINKQGFVAIPKLSILLPIYDNAYSLKALDVGADTAQKGTPVPTMGQGNYTLAAHNWDNGYTGFSALQQHLKQDAPYYQSGQMGTSDWLNGEKIYLANTDGIYTYEITGQKGVDQNDGSVLDVNNRDQGQAMLTIITCLFPDTTKRIITNAKFTKFESWSKASNQEVGYFDTKTQKTNVTP
ncbi:class A sortase [Fructobacillus ficulneus]|uniref:Sortase A, LPXTG specific n=1 Tax=Fructobacillus ficulneus TaxID=157463 RepID=A0A0K8MJE0_9LACO|nr:class A sortase [Fructobacillus ficulneus]GAP00573.1 sortase A, LPXTG specific [Fructobacillus ficulneus]